MRTLVKSPLDGDDDDDDDDDDGDDDYEQIILRKPTEVQEIVIFPHYCAKSLTLSFRMHFDILNSFHYSMVC